MQRLIQFLTAAAVFAVANTLLVGASPSSLLSALIVALALTAIRDGLSSQSHIRAILSMAWLYWGLFSISNLIEALAFRVIPLRGAERAAVSSLCVGLLVAVVLESLSRRRVMLPQQKTALAKGLVWRVPMLALSFFVLYIAAGLAIQPWIMSFYAHRPLPSLHQLLLLQICRGVLDVSCIYPWYRQWAGSRMHAAWLSAYAFAALCGWGPLLLPNRYLPAPIRAAHAVEMGAAGIALGLLAAYVLLRPRRLMDKESFRQEPGPAA